MFFILSKILVFLLSPFWWLIIILIWIFFTKNVATKKRLKIIAVVIGLLFSNPFLYESLVLKWQAAQVFLQPAKYSAIIVLGGMGGYDITHNWHFGESGDRFIQAEKLYHQEFAEKIIVTGGNGKLLPGDDPDEATAIKKELLQSGIPTNAVLLETTSRNTFENAINTKKLLDSLHLKESCLLVTSAMHMPRAKKIFQKAGITVLAFPCNYTVYKKKFSPEVFIPSAQVLYNWNSFLKEIVGYASYKLTGKL